MLSFWGSRISPHRIRRQDGTLICSAVPISRSGEQQYLGSELGFGTSDETVTVLRPENEVFDPVSMASFEGTTITDNHPSSFVRPENWGGYARGHCQHVREGERLPSGERTLVADLVIHDSDLISKVEAGKRAISAGYTCTYEPTPDGKALIQRQIRGNHIAVVSKGRAGDGIEIRDAAPVLELSDFAEICRRYHRRNAIEVPRTLAVRWPAVKAVIDSGENMSSIDELKEQLRTLTDLTGRLITRRGSSRIVESSNEVERLTVSGCGPGEFAQRLAKHNAAYSQFSSDAERGADFARAAREVGAKLQSRFRSKSCTVDRAPVREHATTNDWAESMNTWGKRLRGQ